MANLLANSTVGGKVIETVAGMQTRIDKGLRTVKADVSGLNREVAYFKLKQAAKDRIEGGTVFADDFNGNRFGFELDESRSSNIKISNGKLTMTNVEATGIAATDNAVINQASNIAGNGGRKLVRLENDWIVASVFYSGKVYLFVDKLNGNGFSEFYSRITNNNAFRSSSIISNRNTVYLLLNNGTATLQFDAVNVETNVIIQQSTAVETGQTDFNHVSLAINDTGTELHAAWSSKNATYPNSFNIRKAKGTINSDGTITWSAVEQLTTNNSTYQNAKNPTIAINGDGNAVIFFETEGWYYRDNGTIDASSGMRSIAAVANAVKKSVYFVSTYFQSKPSAIFVPKETNGLSNGRLWVAWTGSDSVDTGTDNIKISYSDDGGISWAAMGKRTSGGTSGHRSYPSMTATKNGKVYIYYQNNTSNNILRQVFDNGVWSAEEVLKKSGISPNPSTLFDLSMSINEPLFIFQDSAKVGFFGNWIALKDVPKTTATAIYNIPSTDYVAAAVAKAGGVSVAAYLNDTLMNAKLEGNEYIFEGSLGADAPATLRLELTRPTIANGDNDALVRILGGRN